MPLKRVDANRLRPPLKHLCFFFFMTRGCARCTKISLSYNNQAENIRKHNVNLFGQLKNRLRQMQKPVKEVAVLTGIAPSNLSNIFNGKKDARGSTLQAIGDALDAKFILVPLHLLPEVDRILSGKIIGPEDIPSTVEQLFPER